ncbi:MAG: PepSY domain-containing protein [Gammaproteobacteria bacterium]|nr:PepSY domain-containing protein [Gammaproteobacteria bacterium]
MSRQTSTPSPVRRKALNQLHRVIGITAGGVLLYLLFTGIPLQFTDELALGQRHVSASAVLDWYGLNAPEEVIGNGEIAFIGGQLYWRDTRIAEVTGYLGSLKHGSLIVGASPGALWLFAETQPHALEILPLRGIVSAIGSHDERIYLLLDHELVRVDEELLNLEAAPAVDIEWIEPVVLAPAAAATYREHFRGYLLTTERLFQDLHSGRLFGPGGVWLVNLSSLLLIVLSITGLWIWWRSRAL